MTGTETKKQPATGTEQRIEAAARALANEVAPESHLEHWGTQAEWVKDKFRRRAALALAAADAVDVLRTAAAPGPAVTAGPECDGYCRGSVCSYCGCCLHTAGPGNCRTASAPVGMRCPDDGCGCEGTAG